MRYFFDRTVPVLQVSTVKLGHWHYRQFHSPYELSVVPNRKD